MFTSFSSQLLSTKFNKPFLRPAIVNRQQLVDKLNRGIQQKMILVSGPAGSGKSTLLSIWLSNTPITSAWLSLDETDDEPRRFLAYLMEALRTISPDIPQDADGILGAGGKIDTQAFTRSLILPVLNELSHDSILVLDDFHLIGNKQIIEVVKLLLYHTPGAFRIAIGSRAEPDLGLSRLRVEHQLNEIRSDELSFSQDEALKFYNDVMGLDLDTKTVTVIESHTEGWIAACQLTALTLARNTDRSSVLARLGKGNKMVADYLAEEVLNNLSPQIRDFLLSTSVLRRQCDSLCGYLLGEDHPKVSLRMLAKENLFVYPLDDHGCWYRYHPLFAEFLRSRLEKTAPKRLLDLHRTASKWFADQKLIHEAADHIIAAKDQSALADHIESHFYTVLFAGDLGTLRGWLNAVDRHLFRERPMLILAEASWELMAYSDNDMVDRSVELAQAALKARGGDMPPLARLTSETFIDMLYAATAYRRGEFRLSKKRAEFARERLPNELKDFETPFLHLIGSSRYLLGYFDCAGPMLDIAERLGLEGGQYLVAFSSMVAKSDIANMRLELREAYRIATAGLQLAKEKGCRLLPVVGGLHVVLGCYYFYKGDYASAQKEIEKGISRYGLMKLWDGTASAYCYLARIRLRMNNVEGARLALIDAQRFANAVGNEDIKTLVLYHQALFSIQTGYFPSAQKCVETSSLKEANSFLIRERINLIRITLSLYSGSYADLLDDIQESIQVTSQRQLFLYSFELRIIKVVVLARLERNQQACLELEKAIEQAMPEGLAFYFEQWSPKQQWSETIRQLSNDIQNDRVRSYIGSFIGDAAEVTNESSESLEHYTLQTGSTTNEALSEREIEVLELISRGMPNGEIAKRLCVSLSTVKSHVQHILRKLRVKNRTEAVHEARSRSLINSFKPRVR